MIGERGKKAPIRFVPRLFLRGQAEFGEDFAHRRIARQLGRQWHVAQERMARGASELQQHARLLLRDPVGLAGEARIIHRAAVHLAGKAERDVKVLRCDPARVSRQSKIPRG